MGIRHSSKEVCRIFVFDKKSRLTMSRDFYNLPVRQIGFFSKHTEDTLIKHHLLQILP